MNLLAILNEAPLSNVSTDIAEQCWTHIVVEKKKKTGVVRMVWNDSTVNDGWKNESNLMVLLMVLTAGLFYQKVHKLTKEYGGWNRCETNSLKGRRRTQQEEFMSNFWC